MFSGFNEQASDDPPRKLHYLYQISLNYSLRKTLNIDGNP
jgi:hypothetical protein